jgi:hypothetical protein
MQGKQGFQMQRGIPYRDEMFLLFGKMDYYPKRTYTSLPPSEAEEGIGAKASG